MKVLASTFVVALMVLINSSAVLAAQGKQEEMRKLFPPKEPVASKSIEPGKTTLLTPEAFSKINASEVTLKWKPVAGADEYHVQVAADANFLWPILNEYHVKETSLTVSNLEVGKHYFWRVLSVTSENESTHRKSPFVSSSFETVAK